jgi:polysaccharide export outer membrane protein
VIFPGDSVKVTIWKEPDISGTFQVDENSILVLPMLGPRSVANTSAEQLRSQLIQDYSAQLKNPSISVSITRRVSVLGAVEKPGLYAVDPTMQLGDIVALAGGVTEEGSSKNIDVERGSTRLYENLELSDAVVPNLRSGDRVVVDKRSWLSRNGKAAFATGLGVATIIARFTIWH